jgi:hypothetical protein
MCWLGISTECHTDPTSKRYKCTRFVDRSAVAPAEAFSTTNHNFQPTRFASVIDLLSAYDEVSASGPFASVIDDAATIRETKCDQTLIKLNTFLLLAIELQPTGKEKHPWQANDRDVKTLVGKRGVSWYAMRISPILQITSSM